MRACAGLILAAACAAPQPPGKPDTATPESARTAPDQESAAGAERRDPSVRWVEMLVAGPAVLTVESVRDDRVFLVANESHPRVNDVYQLVRDRTEHVSEIVITAVDGRYAIGLLDTKAYPTPARKGDEAYGYAEFG